MMTRKIHSDKQGLYVVFERRKFRPPVPTLATTDYIASVSGWDAGKKMVDEVRVAIYEHGYRNKIGEERWTTTQAPPQAKEKLKEGQVDLRVECHTPSRRGYASSTTEQNVIVGADGMNYKSWRKEPSPVAYAHKGTAGANILIPSATMFTWDQWDAFVKKVEEARPQVEIGPIAVKLEAEIRAEDDLQEYLREKGLVESTPEDSKSPEGNL